MKKMAVGGLESNLQSMAIKVLVLSDHYDNRSKR